MNAARVLSTNLMHTYPNCAGDCVVSVPEGLLITADTARRSDFGQALQQLPLDEQSLLLVWLMAERHDTDSPHAPFWRALPQQFCSGAELELNCRSRMFFRLGRSCVQWSCCAVLGCSQCLDLKTCQILFTSARPGV